MDSRAPRAGFPAWASRFAGWGIVALALVPVAGLILVAVAVLTGRAFGPLVIVLVPLYSVVIAWLAVVGAQILRGRAPFALVGAFTAGLLTLFWWAVLKGIQRNEAEVMERDEVWQEPLTLATTVAAGLVCGACLVAWASRPSRASRTAVVVSRRD